MAAAMPASRLMLEVAIVIIGLLLLVFLSGTVSIVLGGYLLSIKTTTTLPLEVICYSVGFAIGAFYGNYSLTKKADAAISFILTLVFFMGAVSAWSSSKTNATEEYSRDLEDIIQKFCEEFCLYISMTTCFMSICLCTLYICLLWFLLLNHGVMPIKL